MLSGSIVVRMNGDTEHRDCSPSRVSATFSRDMASRQAVQSNELIRRAYKYIARNTTLPQRVRHQAQLQLNLFPTKARPTAVKNRCVETGRGRGIIGEFGLCRVSMDWRMAGLHHLEVHSLCSLRVLQSELGR